MKPFYSEGNGKTKAVALRSFFFDFAIHLEGFPVFEDFTTTQDINGYFNIGISFNPF